MGDIGNVSLSCIKAVIGISVHVIGISGECTANYLRHGTHKPSAVLSLIMDQMGTTINHTI
jgi:hypothetical protein